MPITGKVADHLNIKTMKKIIFAVASLFIMNACKQEDSTQIAVSEFGTLADGRKAELYTLTNTNGMEVKITNYGGTITSWTAPDKEGKYENITLGFETVEDYEKGSPYFGAIIGRYGNRIANGKFSIGDSTYQLPLNDGSNSLHGGNVGFDKVLWDATPIDGEEPKLQLTYLSKDGEQGYPGNLNIKVTYTLQKDNALSVAYEATTDKETVINLTNHAYFNLAGHKAGQILDHILTLNADKFLPVGETLIPTGELKNVKQTVFDFTKPTRIGDGIENEDQQIQFGKGYDHCWVFTDSSNKLKSVATVTEPISGRELEVWTTEPAVQFYSGNFMTGEYTGKGGLQYPYRTGFCLETQHFPDSPNQPSFPSTLLKVDEKYSSVTIYKFK